MRRIDRVGKTLTKALAIAVSFSIMFGQTIGSYADELNTINEIITEAETDINTADVEAVDFDSIVIVDTTEVESDLASYDISANASETDSIAAIADANVANTTSDETEAIAAKESAEANLVTAEAALNESNEVLETAQGNFDSVSANYAAADTKYNEAVAALEDVSSNTVAAEQALEEAKALIDIEKNNKEKLENIEDQYYGFMVYYYRNAGKAVYDGNGVLDVDASAALITPEKQNQLATKGDENLFRFGRYLTKELVEYMITNRDDVSANSEENQFTYGVGGGNQDVSGQEAVVFTNNQHQDQTITATTGFKTDVSGNQIAAGKTESYRWERTGKDGGRGNCVEVTYVDKDGVLHTEYYNYVFKQTTDPGDLTTGPIFLATVTRGDKLNNTISTVSDNNNYSDYKKLVAAVEAYQVLDTYTKRYDEALANVTALKEQYAALSVSANASKSELETLKAALDAANTALAEAKEKKTEVTEKYEEAKKAVEGIDLSRFAVVPVPVVNDETQPGAEPAAPATTTPVIITVTPDEIPLTELPVFAGPFGEEENEVEEVAATVEFDDDETPLTAGPAVTAEPEVVKEDVITDLNAATITADIEGEFVPLANLPFTESLKKIWWLWILIVLTAITMYLLYKRYNKNKNN